MYSSSRNYYSSLPAQPNKRPRHKLRLSFLLGLIGLLVGFSVHLGLSAKAAAREATLAKAQHRQSLQQSLPTKVNSLLSQNSGVTFSISLIDLSSGKAQNFGVQIPMEAASTAKLITAADFLHQVELGNESLDEQLGGYSARYELQLMINQSDDTAWSNLNSELGNDQLESYAQSLGLSGYDVSSNQISAADMATLLAKLYKGNLLNKNDTKLLLGFMQKTNYEDLITPAVPVGDQIYHKVGELDDYVHDAAIITDGQQAFVLVIFTNGNGTYSWPARAALMQQITRLTIPAYLD